MGRQLRFYMLPEDEVEILPPIIGEFGVTLLASSSDTPRAVVLDPQEIIGVRRVVTTTVLLWKAQFPLAETAIQAHRLKEYREDLASYVETGAVKYSLNLSNAPVVELDLSIQRADSSLSPGRVWADMYRLEADGPVYKGVQFERWYDAIARSLRRRLTRVQGIEAYLGAHAVEWHRSGGKLR